jgi:hypothetical protein
MPSSIKKADKEVRRAEKREAKARRKEEAKREGTKDTPPPDETSTRPPGPPRGH